MRGAACVLALAIACGGGDDDDGGDGVDPVDAAVAPQDVCTPTGGDDVYFDADDLCDSLSSYRFFADGAGLSPNAGVVPYELNSALFSDYAVKSRHIYLPAGTAMTYHEVDSFDLPVGAVVLKTFAFPADLRVPDADVRLIETRLMVHRADGWKGVTYVWNAEQTDAERKLAGGAVPIEFVHTDGDVRAAVYIVPNENQCKECHEEVDGVMSLVGPKARHLNRVLDFGDGPINQLEHFVATGMLADAPEDVANVAPRAAVFDDPATGSLDERARSYLDINCAHCHNPEGRARTSGLDLRPINDDLLSYGVCKPPVAAGGGSGGLQYNIVPGQPDESILVFRMESVEPDVQMPELGRAIVHAEGVALMREWINSLEGTCDVAELTSSGTSSRPLPARSAH